MRVLLITHNRRFKAAWRSVRLATELAARGHQPTVMCIADTRKFSFGVGQLNGVEIVESPDLLVGKLRSGWDPWDCFRRIQFLRGREFDLIHAFETRPATIHPVLRYLRRRNVPLVIDWIDWWGRGGLIAEQRPWWYQKIFGGMETWYEEHFRPRAHATTVISTGLKRRAVSLGVPEESIFWIPNGCAAPPPPIDQQVVRARFGLPANAFVIGFSALDVTLGVDLVLDTLRQLIERHPQILLIMTGKLSADVEHKITSPELARHVRHLGFVKQEDYLPVLACVDAFVVPFVDKPANWGRWPGRINDYFILGKPIVTNPVGEMKELLTRHEIGLLAGPSPDAMALQVGRLIENPELRTRLGTNARRLAETELSWRTMTDRLEQAYHYAVKAHALRTRAGNSP